MNVKKVWVTIGRTERGEDIGPFVWDYEPPDGEVEMYLRFVFPEEYEGGLSINHRTEEAAVIGSSFPEFL